MKCPYCNEEMEKGSISQNHIGHALYWISNKPNDNKIFNRYDSIKLSALLNGGRVITYHCASCKKFIINEDELEV